MNNTTSIRKNVYSAIDAASSVYAKIATLTSLLTGFSAQDRPSNTETSVVPFGVLNEINENCALSVKQSQEALEDLQKLAQYFGDKP